MEVEEIVTAMTNAISGWMTNFGSTFVEYIANNIDFFNSAYPFGSTVLSSWGDNRFRWLATVHQRVMFFAWMVLLLRVIVDGIRVYIAREAGEVTVSPMVLFRRLIITIGTMSLITFFFAYGHHGISETMGRLIKEKSEAYSRVQGHGMVYATNQWYPSMKSWLTDFNQSWVQQTPTGGVLKAGEIAIRVSVAITVAMGILTFFIQQALRELELVFAWLVGPIASLAPLSTDDPLREGAFAAWLREVLVVSFNQVSTMVILILLYELVDFKALGAANGTPKFTTIVTILALIAIGTQGPRVFRQYAWGNTQAQGIASQLIRLPW